MATRRLRKRPGIVPPVEVPKPTRRGASLDDLDVVPTKSIPKAALVQRAAATFTMRAAEIRRVAASEFITDPDAKAAEKLWERHDRPYRALVKLATFKRWAVEDNWNTRRERFWADIEHKVLQAAGHKILVQRLEEINKLTPASDAMLEYLVPRRDPKTGDVLRYPERMDDGKPHPWAGLPILPLVDPSTPLEKFVASFDRLHKMLMTKRGEVTSRSESVSRDGGDDPATQDMPFTREDVRTLARHMLQLRQPELQGDVLEALSEIDAELEAEDKEALDDEEADEDGG